MTELGNPEKQEVSRWAKNRIENSHLPFRRRERVMLRFRQRKSLQKFASARPTSTTTSTSNATLSTDKLTRTAALPP
jgi:transposase-like protein